MDAEKFMQTSISLLRSAVGWQAAIARLLGVDSRTVRRWIADDATPEWVDAKMAELIGAADADPEPLPEGAAMRNTDAPHAVTFDAADCARGFGEDALACVAAGDADAARRWARVAATFARYVTPDGSPARAFLVDLRLPRH